MKTSKLATVGLVALAYGGIMVMAAAEAPRGQLSAEQKTAARHADAAAKAIARRDAAAAIAAAEQAVTLAPAVAGYRMLLGQSYLQAGRFVSARAAFADTLALDATNGKAALNLALAQVATGDWQAAQRTLASHGGEIPAGDRGLALALAGDTRGAVTLLTDLARSAQATPKARQNLALAYALAGQWQAARVVAAADMSPADVDQRMQQWAAFAQPEAASDQVASLLGVRAVADRGQPTALALNTPAAPVMMAAAEPVSESVAVAAAAPIAPVATPTTRRIVFAAAREVVQPLPVQLIQSGAGPVKVAAARLVRTPAPVRVAAVAPASGQWVVQLGAFDNVGVAKDAWGRIVRRHAGFGGRTPNGMSFKAGATTFYRLSVGGFARADANRMCRAVKARGGDCFVRQSAGDQVAAWNRPRDEQVAMR